MNNVLGQVLTFISYLIFWLSRFKKEKKNILLYDCFSRIFAILAFFFLKSYAGIKNTLYVIVENIIGRKIINKPKKYKIIVFLIMVIILLLLYIFELNRYDVLCLIICSLISLYGVLLLSPQGIRIAGIIASLFYILFLILIHNYIGVVCEIICIIITLCSFIKYYKEDKKLLTK